MSRRWTYRLPGQLRQGDLPRLAGGAQDADGFVDCHEPGVFPHDVEDGRGGGGCERVRLHVQSLQHVPQNRFAFPLAGGVIAAVAAQFRARGGALPEFCQGYRLQPVQVGILQQPGRGAFPCPGGRFSASCFGEKRAQVFGLPAGVQDVELPEEPPLQGSGARTAFLFEAGNALLPCLHFRCPGGDGEFRFLELAFAGHFRRVRFAGMCCAPLVAPVFGFLEAHAGKSCFEAGGLFLFFEGFAEAKVLPVVFEGIDAVVEVGNRLFFRLEETASLLQVVDRGHEVVLAVAPGRFAPSCRGRSGRRRVC